MHSKRDQRRHVRAEAPIDCYCERLTSRQLRLRDVSLGGACAYSENAPNNNDTFEIELLLPERNRFKCMVKVVWVKSLPGEAKAKYEIGLEFVDLSGKELLALAYQIKRISLA